MKKSDCERVNKSAKKRQRKMVRYLDDDVPVLDGLLGVQQLHFDVRQRLQTRVVGLHDFAHLNKGRAVQQYVEPELGHALHGGCVGAFRVRRCVGGGEPFELGVGRLTFAVQHFCALV